MLAIIAVILGLLGMGGTILYVNDHFLTSAANQYENNETHQRLLETATRLQANWRYYTDSGQAYLLQPAPITGTAPYIYSQVPDWLYSNAKSANGVPFLYCPYASYGGPAPSGSGQFRQPADGAATSTDIINDAQTGNQNYVLNSNTALPAAMAVSTTGWANSTAYTISTRVYDNLTQQYYSVNTAHTSAAAGSFAADRALHPTYWVVQTYTTPPLGLLVAAAPGRSVPPNCSDVVSGRNDYPIVPGGMVVPLANNDYGLRMQVPSAPGIPTLYVGTTASGDGSGRGPNDRIAINDALTLLTTLKPHVAQLNLGAGTFAPSVAIPADVTIYFAGSGNGSTSLGFSNLGNAWAIAEGSKYLLTDLTVAGMNNLEVRGELQVQNVLQLNNLHINGGRVLTANTTANSSGSINTALSVDGDGSLIIGGGNPAFNAAGNGGVNINVGALIDTANNNIYITGAAGTVPIYVGAGGRIAKTSWISLFAASGSLTGGAIVYPGGILRDGIGITNAANFGVLSEGRFITENSAASGIYFAGTTPDDGLILANGGTWESTGTDIGQAATSTFPKYAINDRGGSEIHLADSNIYASNSYACWHGRSGTNLFSYSLNTTTKSYAAGSNTAAYKDNPPTVQITYSNFLLNRNTDSFGTNSKCYLQ